MRDILIRRLEKKLKEMRRALGSMEVVRKPDDAVVMVGRR